MKKELLLPAAFLLISIACHGQTMTISYPYQVPPAGNANICFTGQNVLNAHVAAAPPGTTTYSWTVASSSCPASYSPTGSSSLAITFTCCTSYTVICTAYSSSNTLLQTASSTVGIVCAPAPTVTVSSSVNGTACPGTSHTLTASGATSYFWMPAQVNTVNPAVVTPLAGQCFTVFGSNGSCYSSPAVHCTSVMVAPNLSVAYTPTVCEGAPFTMAASGATSYTWNPGNLVSSMIFPFGSLNVTSYTLSVTSGSCVFSGNVYSLQVNPAPALTVTSVPSLSTPVMCGNTVTLSASGAATYTWTNAFYTSVGSTFVDTVFSNVPYALWDGFTLTAHGANGCVADTGGNYPVIPLPLTITGNNTVCLGSSVTLTVSGAQTYTWNTSANTATVNFLPLTNTILTVYGNAANGCIAKDSISITPNSGCAIVWPGDANSDGVVNASDVLEIGLAMNSTGASRPGASNTYTGQQCSAWTGTVSSGKNKCHADCNGDGTVNLNDTLAITNNFLLTHSFRLGASQSAADLFLIPASEAAIGNWNTAEIHLGSSVNPIQLTGLAFDVNFDMDLVQQDSAYILYTGSYLNSAGQNIQFRKKAFASGKIYAASVRTTADDVNGSGKIAEFRFRLKPGIQANKVFNMSLSNAEKVIVNGTHAPLSAGTATLLTSSIAEQELAAFSIFPVPATNELVINYPGSGLVNFFVGDLTGRLLQEGVFEGSGSIDLRSFKAGLYLVTCEKDGVKMSRRIVVAR